MIHHVFSFLLTLLHIFLQIRFEKIYPHLHREYDYELFDVMADYNLSFEGDDKGNRPRSNIFYRDIDGQERVELDHRENIFLTDHSELNDAQVCYACKYQVP